MSLLYVNENGATISIEANRFVVTYKDGMKKSVPAETLESITLLGSVQMTTQSVQECLKRGISIAYFSKGGRYFGRLSSTGHNKASLQRVQSRLYDTPFSVELAKRILKAKIHNQSVLLRRYSNNIDVSDMQLMMKNSIEKIDHCETINEIIGYEGTAARYYFSGLSKCINEDFTFDGRSKRPPLDPFNSMLSLGYSIIMNEIYGEIEARGMNPYFGFVHRDAENHPTLASDMMEEWRAVIIDSTVMSMLNGKEMQLDDFYLDIDEPGIFITKEGLGKYLSKLERKLQTEVKYLTQVDYPVSFRRAISLQLKSLSEAIINEDATMYNPIKIR